MKNQFLVAAIVVAAFCCSTAGAVVIDNFTTDQATLMVSPTGTTTAGSVVSGAEIIGVERDMYLTTGAGAGVISSSAGVDNGALILADNSQFSSSLTVQWDGADGDPANIDPNGLGGIDLTAGAVDAFEVRFLFDDLPATLEMNVYSTDGGSSTFLWPVTGGIMTGLSMFIPYAAFTGSVDFAIIGAIELIVNSPTNGLDMAIDYVHTVVAPVPAPMGLLLLSSALGWLGLRRRSDNA